MNRRHVSPASPEQVASRALSRRSFLGHSARLGLGLAAAPAGAALLAACGSSTSTSAKAASTKAASSGGTRAVSLQLSYLASVEYSGYYLAQTMGYYAAEGVDATLVPGGPSVPIEADVAAGKSLVGIDSADIIMSARQQGAPLVIFGAQFQKNPLGIVSLAGSAVTSPKELVGKTLGVPSSLESTMKQFLELNGVKPADVHFVPYQGDPGPLVNKSIDAGMTFVTETVPFLEAKHIASHSFLFDDFGYHVYNDCPFTTEKVLKERPDDLARWLRASIRGWQLVTADPSTGVDLVVDHYGKSQGLTHQGELLQSREQVSLMVTPTTKAHGLFWMTDAEIAANVKTITGLGIKATTSAFDTSILAAALRGKSTVDGA